MKKNKTESTETIVLNMAWSKNRIETKRRRVRGGIVPTLKACFLPITLSTRFSPAANLAFKRQHVRTASVTALISVRRANKNEGRFSDAQSR